jgi:uncharacterized protein (DUF433 family)
MQEQYPQHQDRIVVNPEIMVGKPIVKGTWIPVELGSKRPAQDVIVETLLEACQRHTFEDERARLEYTQSLAQVKTIHPVPSSP